MTNSLPIALAFEYSHSIEDLVDQLNQVGPWEWRLSESDTYGESLWTIPDDTGRMFRIFREPARWVLQFNDEAPARQAYDRIFYDRIFPGVGASNIYPTDSVY